MKKAKRILALIGAILLALMYVSTLVFALIGSEFANRMLMASFFLTIFVPIVLWAMMMVYRVLKPKKDDEDMQS